MDLKIKCDPACFLNKIILHTIVILNLTYKCNKSISNITVLNVSYIIIKNISLLLSWHLFIYFHSTLYCTVHTIQHWTIHTLTMQYCSIPNHIIMVVMELYIQTETHTVYWHIWSGLTELRTSLVLLRGLIVYCLSDVSVQIYHY